MVCDFAGLAEGGKSGDHAKGSFLVNVMLDNSSVYLGISVAFMGGILSTIGLGFT